MKSLIILTLMACSLLSYGDKKAEEFEARVNATYKAAVQKLNAGDYDTAEKYLKAVLKAKPNHGNARFHFMQLKDLRVASLKNTSQKQISKVTIKKIEFEEVPLNEALEGLKILIDQSNGDELPAPNLVIRDPSRKITDKEVTLSLSHIPADKALQYMLDLVGASVSYGQHIITVLPRG